MKNKRSMFRSRIHERPIMLRFLGIILRVIIFVIKSMVLLRKTDTDRQTMNIHLLYAYADKDTGTKDTISRFG